MKRAAALVLGALVIVTSLSSSQAIGPLSRIVAPVTATATAQAVVTPTDVVRVYQTSGLSADAYSLAASAANSARAAWSESRGASVPMGLVMRGPAIVQQPEIAGYHFPMGVTVLPSEAIAALMGRDVAAVLARGEVVMGATTAGLRDARVGDTIDLEAASGAVVRLTIGMVASDSVIGGTEVLLSPAQGDSLGVTRVTSIVVWGFASRDSIDANLAAYGLEQRADTRVRRSWDPFDPDATLSMSEAKARLGEFAYRVRPNGVDVDVTPTWVNQFMPPVRELYPTGINARCNYVIQADLRAALNDVINAGLAGQIDVANANRYGGCFYPRFNRVAGNLGVLSRHSWGAPLDTNTTTNAQGAAPQMNCDVVRIFRKHNFAWGGNFVTSDGMHFEWVGEQRDQYQFPSRYCPNLPAPPSVTSAGSNSGAPLEPRTMRPRLFVDDGWGLGE
ncbi:MAG: M15 family metallopeptidase [Actinomycetota bacterium]|jgi:hypothetical protein